MDKFYIVDGTHTTAVGVFNTKAEARKFCQDNGYSYPDYAKTKEQYFEYCNRILAEAERNRMALSVERSHRMFSVNFRKKRPLYKFTKC